jgi:hypothetical protein
MALSLLGALARAGPASAAPVAQQDATEPMTGAVDPADLALEPAAFTVDAGGSQGAAIQQPSATQGRATRIERAPGPANPTLQTRLESQNPAAKQPAVNPEPDLIAEIRSTARESVRPLHDQLAESGALEAWSELKTDLGLSKNKWGSEGGAEVDPNLPGRPDASNSASWQDPANRPKTAAQNEVDREVAAVMLEKLIDEIKPWAFSLGGLYLLGYLIKTGYDYSQRKSMRRRERKAALSRRRHARKGRSAKPDDSAN